MVHGNVKMGHTGAIIRYVGKLAGLNGVGAAYTLSEMFIEETSDLYAMLCSAHFKSNREVAMSKLLADDGAFAKRLRHSELLLSSSEISIDTVKNITGGISLVAVLDMAKDLNKNILDQFPLLLQLHAELVASPAFDGIRDWELAFH